MADTIDVALSEKLKRSESGAEQRKSFAEADNNKNEAIPKISGVRRPAQTTSKVVLLRHDRKESEKAKKKLESWNLSPPVGNRTESKNIEKGPE